MSNGELPVVIYPPPTTPLTLYMGHGELLPHKVMCKWTKRAGEERCLDKKNRIAAVSQKTTKEKKGQARWPLVKARNSSETKAGD